MNIKGSFLGSHKVVLVEGFFQERLLSQCMNQGILLKNIRFLDETSMTFVIKNTDFRQFSRIAKKMYRVSIKKEGGYQPFLKRCFQRKITLLGMALFLGILYYQSFFISEIRISGYERLQETTVRQALSEVGFYEGCRKDVDLEDVKTRVFSKLDNISWIGIKYTGSMAQVTLVEGTNTGTPIDMNSPTHIIAKKDGYIEQIIARDGLVLCSKGTSVKAGQTIISGVMTIEDKAYTGRSKQELLRFVHASGEVKARVPYRIRCYQEKKQILKQKTGKHFYGIDLTLGDISFNTAKWIWPYDSAVYEERIAAKALRPFPMQLSLVRLSEVKLYEREREEKEILHEANRQARRYRKENIPENAQILNNSLKFSTKENIIEVTIMLHALEEIGMEKPFSAGAGGSAIEGAKEE